GTRGRGDGQGVRAGAGPGPEFPVARPPAGREATTRPHPPRRGVQDRLRPRRRLRLPGPVVPGPVRGHEPDHRSPRGAVRLRGGPDRPGGRRARNVFQTATGPAPRPFPGTGVVWRVTRSEPTGR